MDYELAKELKNAGFSQNMKGNEPYGMRLMEEEPHKPYVGPYMTAVPIEKVIEATVRIPTLEELIEACGDGYFTLQSSQLCWEAFRGLTNTKFGRGSTPNKAVAKLWLLLNKK